jgi:cytochrome b pre-mRNA-processing protein 3
MFKRFRARGERRQIAGKLYDALVIQSRDPAFYRSFGVPDTMLGRYEMICLHAFLVLKRLQREGPEGRALAQTLHDQIFDDLDVALREAGLGDMGVGKRLKKLARNLHGRISAYEKGLVEGEASLDAALRRNLYASAKPTDREVSAMATYLRRSRECIDDLDAARMFIAQPVFPKPEPDAPDASGGVT